MTISEFRLALGLSHVNPYMHILLNHYMIIKVMWYLSLSAEPLTSQSVTFDTSYLPYNHSSQVLEMTIREICRDVCIEGEGPRRKQKAGVWGPPRPPEALGLLVNKLYTLGLFEPMTA